jgi:hypothetical protein
MSHTLATTLKEQTADSKIAVIGQYIQNHVDENWDVILSTKKEQLEHAFATVGEPSYGTYLNFLYQAIHAQLEEAGLHASVRFPGDMNISREWGTNLEQTDQYRCLWTTLSDSASDQPIGTIVTVLPHDHTRFRVPEKPPVLFLEETNKEDIVANLSNQFAEHDFANLIEFQTHVAQWREQQEKE